MTIDLAKVEFVNDIFSATLPDGSIIVINKVDESITSSAYTGQLPIKRINLEVMDTEGNIIDCPCVIGLGNDILEIRTDYKDQEGEALTPDNMELCVIEIYE